MEIWVVICISCITCNRISSAVFNHEPTSDDIQKVRDEIGGMYCIIDYVMKFPTFEVPQGRAIIE